MEMILPALLLVLMACVLLLNFLSLPANWIMLGMIFMWAYFGNVPIDTSTLMIVTGLAILGEVFEFATQIWGGKKYGSSGVATFGGIVGSICGAIILAPIFFGIGAIFGALLGAYFGTFFVEKMRGLENAQAFASAKGALIGRFLGIIIKLGFGIAMLAYTSEALLGAAELTFGTSETNDFFLNDFFQNFGFDELDPKNFELPNLNTDDAVKL